MSKTFAARLNRLFDTVYPPGRGPHTSAEVIAALKSEGVTMSAPYLSQLRSGNRTNPSAATMAALANFFRIKPAYFTDDEYYEKLARSSPGSRTCGTKASVALRRALSACLLRPSRTSSKRSMSCVARSIWTISPSSPALRLPAKSFHVEVFSDLTSVRYCVAISRIHSRSE